MYNASIKQKWDEQSRWETAMSMGMEKGRQEERAKAEADKLRFASNLRKIGVSKEDISKTLGLSPNQIEWL